MAAKRTLAYFRGMPDNQVGGYPLVRSVKPCDVFLTSGIKSTLEYPCVPVMDAMSERSAVGAAQRLWASGSA